MDPGAVTSMILQPLPAIILVVTGECREDEDFESSPRVRKQARLDAFAMALVSAGRSFDVSQIDAQLGGRIAKSKAKQIILQFAGAHQ